MVSNQSTIMIVIHLTINFLVSSIHAMSYVDAMYAIHANRSISSSNNDHNPYWYLPPHHNRVLTHVPFV